MSRPLHASLDRLVLYTDQHCQLLMIMHPLPAQERHAGPLVIPKSWGESLWKHCAKCVCCACAPGQIYMSCCAVPQDFLKCMDTSQFETATDAAPLAAPSVFLSFMCFPWKISRIFPYLFPMNDTPSKLMCDDYSSMHALHSYLILILIY